MSLTKEIFIPYFLVEAHIEANNLRYFAYFLAFKHHHRNSKIYPHSLRQLADKFNCSVTTVRHYMDWFIANGYANRLDNGVIQFIKKSELCRKLGAMSTGKGIFYRFNTATPGKKLIYEIETALIQKNISQQKFIIDKKKKIANTLLGIATAKRSYKKMKSLISEMKQRGFTDFTHDSVNSFLSLNEKNLLSNRQIGNIIYRSSRTASRRQKLWNDLGIIKSKFNYVKLEKMTLQQYLLKKKAKLTGQNTFFKQGYECKRTANEILLSLS